MAVSIHWTGLLVSPKLPAIKSSFRAGQKLNAIIHSITLLNCSPACSRASFMSFLEVKGHIYIE